MASNQTFDPVQLWKSWYDLVEKTWGKTLDDFVRTPEYSSLVGEYQKWFFYSQEQYKKIVDQLLSENNVPNKEEIAHVAQLVIQLEEKVEKLDERLDDEILVKLDEIKEALEKTKSSGRKTNDQ
jgi:polyhydroxyalkanoic acid synthase PhaR subunit